MFNVSDRELDGLEAKDDGGGAQPAAAWAPFGDTQDVPGPGSEAPAPLPAPLPYPSPGGGAQATGAGRALVFITVGLIGGWIAGGPIGGAAGIVTAGSLRNLMRTKQTWSSPSEEDRVEAGKSLTMGIFGLGVAAMLGYQAYKMKTEA